MIRQALERIGACKEAILWAEKKPDWSAVIRDCKRSDWLLWLDEKLGILTNSERRLLACWMVRNTPLADGRKVWDLLTDDRSRNAVEVAERYARGEATDQELSAARAAAGAAAWAAAWAAEAAARAAAGAAHAAACAARDAAWAAARDARDAAWDAARDTQARHIIDLYADRFITAIAITNAIKP